MTIFNAIEYALGAYVRGQGVMVATVGLFSFVGLLVLGIPFAPLLAAIAGLMEALPVIGPVLGAIPAILIAAITAPEKVPLVLLLYFLIQQVESAVLVPKIMERQVGLRPLVVILALAAGSLLGGVTGALVAIPIVAALQILTRVLIIEPTVQANAPQTIEGGVLVGDPFQPAPVESIAKPSVEATPPSAS